MTENEIAHQVYQCAPTVHQRLGAGLLESAYEEGLPLIYDEIKLHVGYRLDLLIEQKVIIELKSVDALNDVHTAQVITYLKLSGCKLGLLINFNVALLKDGVRRLVNKL